MFQDIVISPSILSADFSKLGSEIAAIESAGADWVHVDVMDGHFVPNLSIGVPILHSVAHSTKLPIDVHLMISNPGAQIPWYLEQGPDLVTFHWEALGEGQEEDEACALVEQIHAAGARAGIALKPNTPVGVLDSTLSLWDMILIMSVYPGFSGQSYIPESAMRVRSITEMCEQAGVAPLIQVDGGINSQTAALVAAFGADVLVAGNAVFKADNYADALNAMRKSAQGAQQGSR